MIASVVGGERTQAPVLTKRSGLCGLRRAAQDRPDYLEVHMRPLLSQATDLQLEYSAHSTAALL